MFLLQSRLLKKTQATEFYRILLGDTLYGIALKHNITLQQVQEWNNIVNVNEISVGDVLGINGYFTPQVNFATREEFIEIIGEDAKQIAVENNLYTSVMLGRAAHESAWGNSELVTAANNLFGIKAQSGNVGDYVTMPTWEVINGKDTYVDANFRAYSTLKDSMRDYANLLRNNSRYSGTWVENTASHHDAINGLVLGGYATDPNYSVRVTDLIAAHHFVQYDEHIEITDPIASQQKHKLYCRSGNSKCRNLFTTKRNC